MKGQQGLEGMCDPVLDLVGMLCNDPKNAGIVKRNLRRVIKGINTCQGKFFLIVERSWTPMRKGGPELCEGQKIITTDLWMGIISGELSFGKDLFPLNIPTSAPLAYCDLIHDPEFWSTSYPLLLGFDCAQEIRDYFQRERSVVSPDDLDWPGINVAIGDEEVKELVCQYQSPLDKHRGELPLLKPVIEMGLLLKRVLLDFPEQDDLLQKDKKLFDAWWRVATSDVNSNL
ncbi:MAG: hypothetical protein PHF35_04465 [Candidatus Moranbacteria bacterium]|nr:hypothetical protein [Candidatus Moranbacteria bacterium]